MYAFSNKTHGDLSQKDYQSPKIPKNTLSINEKLKEDEQKRIKEHKQDLIKKITECSDIYQYLIEKSRDEADKKNNWVNFKEYLNIILGLDITIEDTTPSPFSIFTYSVSLGIKPNEQLKNKLQDMHIGFIYNENSFLTISIQDWKKILKQWEESIGKPTTIHLDVSAIKLMKSPEALQKCKNFSDLYALSAITDQLNIYLSFIFKEQLTDIKILFAILGKKDVRFTLEDDLPFTPPSNWTEINKPKNKNQYKIFISEFVQMFDQWLEKNNNNV